MIYRITYFYCRVSYLSVDISYLRANRYSDAVARLAALTAYLQALEPSPMESRKRGRRHVAPTEAVDRLCREQGLNKVLNLLLFWMNLKIIIQSYQFICSE